VVRVFVRRLPAVNQQIEVLLNQVEKRKTAPLLEEPFRNVGVAGAAVCTYRIWKRVYPITAVEILM
jgi:hypothetical protein